jgi:hypothetical protein
MAQARMLRTSGNYRARMADPIAAAAGDVVLVWPARSEE